MSKLIFKPSHFEDGAGYIDHKARQLAADFANTKFSEWLSEQQFIVTADGAMCGGKWYLDLDNVLLPRFLKATHKARIVCIEEIKKEPCKHPWENIKCVNYEWVCECGKKMKPSSLVEYE